jgi:hypothetical protein
MEQAHKIKNPLVKIATQMIKSMNNYLKITNQLLAKQKQR